MFRRVSAGWSSSSWFCMVLNSWLLYRCFLLASTHRRCWRSCCLCVTSTCVLASAFSAAARANFWCRRGCALRLLIWSVVRRSRTWFRSFRSCGRWFRLSAWLSLIVAVVSYVQPALLVQLRLFGLTLGTILLSLSLLWWLLLFDSRCLQPLLLSFLDCFFFIAWKNIWITFRHHLLDAHDSWRQKPNSFISDDFLRAHSLQHFVHLFLDSIAIP